MHVFYSLSRLLASGLLWLLLFCPALARAQFSLGGGDTEGQVPGAELQGLVANAQELQALQDFYSATGGDQWRDRTGWPGTDQAWQQATLAQAATWSGVSIVGGDVVALRSESNALVGPLPASLGLLGQLQELRLGNAPRLTGPLPASLFQLTQLRTLHLFNTGLSGSLPPQLGQLGQLRSLLLAKNNFKGTIPAELGQLTYLTYLNLSDSYQDLYPLAIVSDGGLNGSVTPEDGGLQPGGGGLQDEENGNHFSGPIPASLGQLTQLVTLRLSLHGGATRGPLPAWLSSLSQLSTLSLTNCRLTGAVPAWLVQLPQLQTLQLEENELTFLPDFRQAAAPRSLALLVGGNRFDFADLERNTSTPPSKASFRSFTFAGQSPQPGTDTAYAVRGSQPVLSRPMGGNLNFYQWERLVGSEWVTLPGMTGQKLMVPSMNEAAEGHYRTRVTHDWFAGTVLYTRPVYLSQLPYAPLPLNEPNGSVVSVNEQLAAPTNRPVGQTDPVNYVRTYAARTAYTDPADVRRAFTESRPQDVAVSTQYLDGLGRPVQTVQHAASPTGRDLVQRTEYDALGREPRQYLPYSAAPAAADAATGYHPDAVAAQYQFYKGQGQDPRLPQLTATLPKTGVAYAETVFEASPLNKPRAQASAGESWQLGGGHETTLDERANVATDSVQRWEPGYGGDREELKYEGAYAAGELWVSTSRDEQGQWQQRFTDKEGRVVLSQVGLDGTYQQVATSWLKTYYVFDDFGRLRAVLPPLAVQRLRKNNWQLNGAGVERLLFRYHHDAQGRLTEKQVPDQAGYQYIIYNALDQPILTQAVSQQATKEWVGTKYDALGRVIYTGLVRFTALTGTPSQQYTQLLGWQSTWLAGNASVPLWEEPSATATMGRAYYSARSWPALGPSGAELLSVAYYDNYDFNQDGQPDVAYQPPTAEQLACGPGEVPEVDLRVTGQATGSWVRVLGRAATAADAWLSSSTFFDEKLRPIQVQATNARGGTDVSTSRYDFAGQALNSYATHQVPGQPQRAVREQRAYDNQSRLLTVTQELDGAPAQVLARHTYNELGQLEKKELGGQWASGTPVPRPGQAGPKALQTVDYRYNIRGWLTNINDIEQVNPADGDLWSFALSYDAGFQDRQYNGNIAGQRWRAASDGVERAYGYRYDKLGRLLQGDFVARPTPAAGWGAERGNYRFSSASYDAGGNLLTLRRRGLVAAASRTVAAQCAETDNLRYRYQPGTGSSEPASNRLVRVDDLAPAATAFGANVPERPDFSDGSTTGSQQPDYTYDAAGSLTSDANKGIRLIRYNHLQLPERLEWSNGNVLEYTYSAAGQKVSKLATEAGKPAVRTDYLGPWQYERDSLRWLTHAEGRALYLYKKDLAGQPSTKVSYEYTLKDHLGNLRVAFHPGERTSYYAGLEPSETELRREQRQFDSVSVSAPIRRVDPLHQLARTGTGLALLNAGGAAPQPLGPLKQLSVARGDTVDVVAYGMYQQPARTGWGFSLAGFVASLLQPAAGLPPPPDGGRRVRVLPLLSVGLGLVPAVQQLAGGVPKAYLRMLVYNADSLLVDSQTKQLTSAAQGGYERLSLRVFVPAAGYVQAYVANESDTDVFFDDISVEHRQGLQVQENQYDPFGLDLVGLSRTATPQNKYSWNGKERQGEFGLNWHDHGWRFYDPALGRWVVTDPDGEEGDQEGWTSYQFGLDNAVRYNDLDGRQAGDPGDDVPTLARGLVDFGASLANVFITAASYTGPSAASPLKLQAQVYETDNSLGIEYNIVPKGSPVQEAKSFAIDAAIVALNVLPAGRSGAGRALEQGSRRVVAAEAGVARGRLPSPSTGDGFVVTKEGTVMHKNTGQLRASLEKAGYPGTPTNQTAETGTRHTLPNPFTTVKPGKGPVNPTYQARVMNGQPNVPRKGPRVVTTRGNDKNYVLPNGSSPPDGTPLSQRKALGHTNLTTQ